MSQTGQCSYCLGEFPENDLVVVDIFSAKKAEAEADPWTFFGAVCSKCRTGGLAGKWRDVKKRPQPTWANSVVAATLLMGTGEERTLTERELASFKEKELRRHGVLRADVALDPNEAAEQFDAQF